MSSRSTSKLHKPCAAAWPPLCKGVRVCAADWRLPSLPLAPTRPLVAGGAAAHAAADLGVAAAAGRPTCHPASAWGLAPARRCRQTPMTWWSGAIGGGSGASAPRLRTGSWARPHRTCTAGPTGACRRRARRRPRLGGCTRPSLGLGRPHPCRDQRYTALASFRHRPGGMRSSLMAGTRQRLPGSSSRQQRPASRMGMASQGPMGSIRAATLPCQSSIHCCWRQVRWRHCRGQPAGRRKERLSRRSQGPTLS